MSSLASADSVLLHKCSGSPWPGGYGGSGGGSEGGGGSSETSIGGGGGGGGEWTVL